MEGRYLANTHAITYLEWLWAFQLPVTLGNAAGGVFFVALVNWAQAVGAGRDVEVAERQTVVERVREAVVEKRAEHAARNLVHRNDVDQVEQKLDEKGERAHRIVRRALDEAGGDEE